MSSKVSRDDKYLIDKFGSRITRLHSENDKRFAVIVRCGHCGDGNFIPIMFTVLCKDIYTAIEAVKTNPRVQRDKEDVILAAFEITEHEQFFIEAINDHDPYLRGMHRKDDDQILDRRVYAFNDKHSINSAYNKRLDERIIKTADEYRPYYVLERTFAPRRQGNKIVPATTRINKDELLKEFFKASCIRFSIKQGNPFMLCLYYQQYGKNNELGIKYETGYLHFYSDGKKRTFEVPDEMCVFMDAKIAEEKQQEKLQRERVEYSSLKPSKRMSNTEKFYSRMQKHYQKIGDSSGEQSNGSAPEF